MTGLSFIRPMTGAGLVVAALGIAGCASTATTYGTGVSPGKQTFKDLASIVSLGGDDGPSIDYTPRPPIVTPPSTAALPPPEDKSAIASAGNWPNDPDQAAAARSVSLPPNTDSAPASVRLLAADDPKLRLPTGQSAGTPSRPMTKHEYVDSIIGTSTDAEKAKKIFLEAKKDQNGSVDANGNPVRRYLTEPPADYRDPDPSAPVAIPDKPKKKKPFQWSWPWASN